LIEAPTGSGKTEAAFTYAWRLIEDGVANSIVLALPTQATANAMLARAKAFAERVFGDANVVGQAINQANTAIHGGKQPPLPRSRHKL